MRRAVGSWDIVSGRRSGVDDGGVGVGSGSRSRHEVDGTSWTAFATDTATDVETEVVGALFYPTRQDGSLG
jgi:hypothetical protein